MKFQFPPKFNLKPANVLKIAGLVIIAIIIVVVAFRLIGSSLKSVFEKTGINNLSFQSKSFEVAQEAGSYSMDESFGLSVRNVTTKPAATPAPTDGITMGDEAEDFEVTAYSATVETRHLKNTCATVANLKARDYVIFENANEYDKGCNYSFKVKRDNVNEVLGIIKGLNPKDFSENTYTIKKLVEDFTSEIDILEKKLASIEETLTKAMGAYDDVTKLAIQVKDVESLAKIIDSKINIIERLTQERINVNAQLERIERAKAEQLDRLEYTYFYVYMYENKFIDGEEIRDSWKASIKDFVRDVNQSVQDITVNLVALLILAAQYALYVFILIVIAKYGWQLAKYIWKK